MVILLPFLKTYNFFEKQCFFTAADFLYTLVLFIYCHFLHLNYIFNPEKAKTLRGRLAGLIYSKGAWPKCPLCPWYTPDHYSKICIDAFKIKPVLKPVSETVPLGSRPSWIQLGLINRLLIKGLYISACYRESQKTWVLRVSWFHICALINRLKDSIKFNQHQTNFSHICFNWRTFYSF